MTAVKNYEQKKIQRLPVR